MPEISIICVGFDEKPAEPKMTRTPWGDADHVEKLGPGVIQVATPSHGGIGVRINLAQKKLSDAAMANAIIEHGHAWFEEDCDWAIVCHEMPDLFSDRHRQLAAESLKRWNETYLERTSA